MPIAATVWLLMIFIIGGLLVLNAEHVEIFNLNRGHIEWLESADRAR